MLQIQQLTSNALQSQTLVLPDGSTILLTLYYRPLQYGWFINELTHLDFTVKGVRVCNSPNLLHQFRNQIPFGLCCVTTGQREPTQQQDFSSGAANLYLLTADEVQAYTEFLAGG